jgi:CHASE2 domain-containing sensor protein
VKRKWKRLPEWLRRWGLLALCGGVLTYLDKAGWFEELESIGVDSRFLVRERALPGQVSAEDLLVLSVGEKDLRTVGRWPWPRNVHGDLLALMATMEPKVVAFDVLFTEPMRSSDEYIENYYRENDLYLAEAAGALPVVVAASFGLSEEGETGMPVPLPDVRGELQPINVRNDPLMPYKELLEATKAGFVNSPPDKDGVWRLAPLVVRHGDHVYPSLSTQALMTFWGIGPEDVTVVPGRHVEFRTPEGNVRAPINGSGQMALNFRSLKVLEERQVRPFTPFFSALLGHVNEGEPWPEGIPNPKGKLVLMGVTAEGIDVGATPLRAVTPLVYTHAVAINGILQGDFVKMPSAGVTWLIWLVLTGLSLHALKRASILKAVALPIGMALCYVAAAYGLFIVWSLQVPLVWTLIGFAGFHGGSTVRRWYLSHEAQLLVEGELRAAGDIQRGMLPKVVEVIKGHEEKFDIAAELIAAKENSGDFYDIFWLASNRICLVVGDVCDKGIVPSTFMVMSKTIIHALARPELSVEEIVSKANDALSDRNEKGMFATILIAVIDLKTGEMDYTTAGHHGPILLYKDGTVKELPATEDFAVGPISGMSYEKATTVLKPGELLFLCTDGVTEAFNEKQKQFGISGTFESLKKSQGESCDAVLKSVLVDIRRFAGREPQSDDITMLAFSLTGDV